MVFSDYVLLKDLSKDHPVVLEFFRFRSRAKDHYDLLAQNLRAGIDIQAVQSDRQTLYDALERIQTPQVKIAFQQWLSRIFVDVSPKIAAIASLNGGNTKTRGDTQTLTF